MRDGRSILQQQWEALTRAFLDSRTHIVVGFKKELIMSLSGRLFVYNPTRLETNTSKSLPLRLVDDSGVLWLNGDVVFDPRLLERFPPTSRPSRRCLQERGLRRGGGDQVRSMRRHKSLEDGRRSALGKAVGIQLRRGARPTDLEACDDSEYFEGIETAIAAKDTWSSRSTSPATRRSRPTPTTISALRRLTRPLNRGCLIGN